MGRPRGKLTNKRRKELRLTRLARRYAHHVRDNRILPNWAECQGFLTCRPS